MKTSFKKTEETAEQEDNSKALVPQTPRPLAAAMPAADDFQGEWLRKDQRLPRINLVQKVSAAELIKSFGIGALVLAKEVRLSDGETPLVVTALQAAKDYVQKVEFDSGDSPAIFRTEDEVLQAGGSLNWKDVDSGQFFQPRAHIEFAVAAPEGASDTELALFPYEFEGQSYALAIYTVASSAYTSLAKELATMRSANKVLRQGLRFGSLKLTVETRKKNTREWQVPVARFNGANTPELIKFFEEIEPSLKA